MNSLWKRNAIAVVLPSMLCYPYAVCPFVCNFSRQIQNVLVSIESFSLKRWLCHLKHGTPKTKSKAYCFCNAFFVTMLAYSHCKTSRSTEPDYSAGIPAFQQLFFYSLTESGAINVTTAFIHKFDIVDIFI